MLMQSDRSPPFGGLIIAAAATASADSITADKIYEDAGVQGGLVVHLGCGDGALAVALRVNDRYLVHGLDVDAAGVATTRDLFRSRGLYAPVSANQFNGQNLPYVRDLVNLVVVSELGDVANKEIERVLATEALPTCDRTAAGKRRSNRVRQRSTSGRTSSAAPVATPWPTTNELGRRTAYGGWAAEPRWCRRHEFLSSVNAVVTAGGRIFTIFDGGPTGVYKLVQKAAARL